jgi:hypothetical protein
MAENRDKKTKGADEHTIDRIITQAETHPQEETMREAGKHVQQQQRKDTQILRKKERHNSFLSFYFFPNFFNKPFRFL